MTKTKKRLCIVLFEIGSFRKIVINSGKNTRNTMIRQFAKGHFFIIVVIIIIIIINCMVIMWLTHTPHTPFLRHPKKYFFYYILNRLSVFYFLERFFLFVYLSAGQSLLFFWWRSKNDPAVAISYQGKNSNLSSYTF